jgi:hypothetical protein
LCGGGRDHLARVVRTTGPNDAQDGLGAAINWVVPRYNINILCVYMYIYIHITQRTWV